MPTLSKQFKDFILSKKSYVNAYANSEVVDGWRTKAFQLKSHLTGESEKDRQLYMRYNYFRLVSKVYADYEVWDGIMVFFPQENTQNKIIEWVDHNNIQQLLYNTMIQKSKVGYCIVRLLKVGDVVKAEKIPVTNYYCSTDGVSLGASFYDIPEHHIISYHTKMINGEEEMITRLDSYYKDGDQWKGEYATYRYDANMEYGDKNRIGELIIERLDHLNLFLFNGENLEDDLPDTNKIKQDKGAFNLFFAQSDYVDIMDIIQDINDRQSQISVEFIKNLSSKISLPKSYFESMQNLNMGQLLKGGNIEDKISNSIENFDYITHGDGETPAQYITKDASMIDRAFEKIERDVRAISTFTSIPVYMLGLETASGNRHVGTDEKDSEAFLQKITRRRAVLYTSLQLFFAYAAWLLGAEYTLPTIKFAKLPNGDLATKVEIASKMKENGFLSQRSLIKFVNNFDDLEYEEEKLLLDQELSDEYAIKGDIDFLDIKKEK